MFGFLVSLKCVYCLAGPDTSWDQAVVNYAPVGKGALDEGILGVGGFTISNAFMCCMSCLVWEIIC